MCVCMFRNVDSHMSLCERPLNFTLYFVGVCTCIVRSEVRVRVLGSGDENKKSKMEQRTNLLAIESSDLPSFHLYMYHVNHFNSVVLICNIHTRCLQFSHSESYSEHCEDEQLSAF